MAERVDYAYSLRVFMGLLVTIGPGVVAWFGTSPLDAYPKWVLLASGCGLSVLAVRRRIRRRKASAAAPRSSTRYPGAMAPFQMLLSVLGPPCWCLAIGLIGNQRFDTAPPVAHPVRFVSYHKEPKSKAVVTVSSWRSPGEDETLRFDPLTFGGIGWRTPSGTAVEVLVKPGFFGWEWVVGVRRARTP